MLRVRFEVVERRIVGS
uniref:Uncharacterized protein n=1 Tax=Arundo donax TaxID=35708 RepID=A0A0A8YTW7_ARUDO